MARYVGKGICRPAEPRRVNRCSAGRNVLCRGAARLAAPTLNSLERVVVEVARTARLGQPGERLVSGLLVLRAGRLRQRRTVLDVLLRRRVIEPHALER